MWDVPSICVTAHSILETHLLVSMSLYNEIILTHGPFFLSTGADE